jgi:hypothetical protein
VTTRLATIDLDPRDGDMDLIEALDRAFAIKLKQSDVGHWRTIGDAHATLQALAPVRYGGDCPSQIAFHRLRAALVARGHARAAIRPSVPLADLTLDHPARLLRQVGRGTGLATPTLDLNAMGYVASVALLASFIAVGACFFTAHWLALLVCLAVLAGSVCLFLLDKGRFPASLTTIADLAERTAALSRGKQALAGARDLPDGHWRTLVAILAELTRVDPAAIGPDTYLFRKVYQADRCVA